jgi:hypothetical protein
MVPSRGINRPMSKERDIGIWKLKELFFLGVKGVKGVKTNV